METIQCEIHHVPLAEMREIVGFVLAAALLAAAFKAALILLVAAGLIFRTKETFGLLMLGGVIAGFAAHPLIGVASAAALLTVSLHFKRKEKQAALP